jgi:magnesium chelatase family protein
MNPCSCGYYPDRNKCKCNEVDIKRYLGKISRPLLDRLDLLVEVSSIDYKKVKSEKKGESSDSIKARIETARKIQEKRFMGKSIQFNAYMSEGELKEICILDKEGEDILEKAYKLYDMTVRGYHKVLKVARTIADLEESELITSKHICEAVCYRSLDKKYWGN